MSKLIVDEIAPFSVGPVKLDSDVEVNGSMTINGADGVSANLFTGDGSGLSNLPINPFNGNTSGNCIQELWLEYLNGCNGLLNIAGDVNVNGFVSADTYYGDSSNLTKEINNIVPIGSGATSVNAYLQYGINLITTATTSNYCVRLPLTPIEGREVIVINNSGFNIYVFPSMVGGSINGIVNGANIVPSDGKRYTFVCYENPNPGQWSSNVLAAPGQYDSGVISIDTTVNVPPYYVCAVDDNFKSLVPYTSTFNSSYDGLNRPYIFGDIGQTPASYLNCISSFGAFSANCGWIFFKPVVPWNQITKLTLYTNFTTGTTTPGQYTGATSPGPFSLLQPQQTNYYSAGTTYFLNDGPGNFGFSVEPNWYKSVNQRISGVPTTIANGFTANPGDPGTYFGELIYTPGLGPSLVGDILLSSGTMYVSGGTEGPGVFDVDLWYNSFLIFHFETRRKSSLVKFRFLIDYII